MLEAAGGRQAKKVNNEKVSRVSLQQNHVAVIELTIIIFFWSVCIISLLSGFHISSKARAKKLLALYK